MSNNAELPAGDTVHAGFWRRAAAYSLDSLVLAIPTIMLNLIPILGLIMVVVGRWLYFALMESSEGQGTLGKRAMGLKVTDAGGRRIGFGQATGRYFAAALSTIVFAIGYMMAGWTARKQALHDLMAGSCVVFEEVQPEQAPPGSRPPMPWYGWVLNILLVLFLALAPLGIIFAIAIPAYHDYVERARRASAEVEHEAIGPQEAAQAAFRRSLAFDASPITVGHRTIG